MNLYTLHNDTLTVTLDACGAVLHSIVKDGAEYLWQGDAKYWARRDANLFPYVGRLTDGQYLLDGKTYAQQEVADKLGISRSYVSRIEKKALERLKHAFETGS